MTAPIQPEQPSWRDQFSSGLDRVLQSDLVREPFGGALDGLRSLWQAGSDIGGTVASMGRSMANDAAGVFLAPVEGSVNNPDPKTGLLPYAHLPMGAVVSKQNTPNAISLGEQALAAANTAGNAAFMGTGLGAGVAGRTAANAGLSLLNSRPGHRVHDVVAGTVAGELLGQGIHAVTAGKMPGLSTEVVDAPTVPRAGEPFAVITAHNPGGVPASAEANAAAHAQLGGALESAGYPIHETTGRYTSPKTGETLSEQGYYVPGMAPEKAVALGKQFGQEGVLTHLGYHDVATGDYYPSRGVAPTEGVPHTEMPDGSRWASDIDFGGPTVPKNGNADVLAIARQFQEGKPQLPRVASVDASKAAQMARAYEQLPANDPAARSAYDALNEEVAAQKKAFEDAGYRFEYTNKDPYTSSADMMKDVRDNKRLKVFATKETTEPIASPALKLPDGRVIEGKSHLHAALVGGFPRGDTPAGTVHGWTTESGAFLPNEEVDRQLGDYLDSHDFNPNRPPRVAPEPFHPYMTAGQNNDFRAVHDLLAHAGEGHQFGPKGEENAYRVHASTLSPLAQRALATETRGQNSWVNYGPHAALPVAERPFAPQKAALFPEHMLGDYGAMTAPDAPVLSHSRDSFGNLQVEAHHPTLTDAGKPLKLGHVQVAPDGSVSDAYVNPAYRRQGVASSMYDHASNVQGGPVQPGADQSPAAKAFWQDRTQAERRQTPRTADTEDARAALAAAYRQHGKLEGQRSGPRRDFEGELQKLIGGRHESQLSDAELQQALALTHMHLGSLDARTSAPDPATKPVASWTPAELEAYGQQHGVPGLGIESPDHKVQLTSGREVNIPGGTDGKWSYYDLLKLKAQGINPRELPPELHDMIQQKFGRTLTPEPGDDMHNFTGLLMGQASINNPLTPNEFAVARMMPRSMGDVEQMANMPHETKADEAAIAAHYNLNAGSEGGIGARGTADYRSVANMARLFAKDPLWFRKAPEESWQQHVERLASQVKGLSVKTGSFGSVWQDPANADISAIDRHMGDVYWDKILADPARKAAVEKQLVGDWNANAKAEGRQKVKTVEQLREQPGGESAFKDKILDLVTNHQKTKLDLAKGGVNPKAPEWAKSLPWIERPTHVTSMGQEYSDALDANAESAHAHGLGIFGEQHRAWDFIRGRLEPHEIMYPGLNRLPRMPLDEIKASLAAHKEAGYMNNKKSSSGAVGGARPVANPMSLAHWAALMSVMGAGGLLGRPQDQQR